jgi:hypothetical protein
MKPGCRLVLAVVASLVFAGGARAQPDTSWSAIYRKDLGAARAIIAANHPGVVDRLNPAFARPLASAYRRIISMRRSVLPSASRRAK